MGLSDILAHDPVPWLRSAGDPAITAWVDRDLLGKKVELAELWLLREPQRLIGRQQPDGSWRYPVRKPKPFNYDLYQTFNTLGVLIRIYGLDRRHPAVERAAAYVFSCQADAGDYRGIYGSQPAHTYTAALIELLIEAGYHAHPSIDRGFCWLLETRQDDGGWALPARTVGKSWDHDGPLVADRTKPFSHLVTGMVLRAFAADPRRRRAKAAKEAATLVKSRFFKPDKYSDRRARHYWTTFAFPFHFTNLLAALDSLGRLGSWDADDPDVACAIDWFRAQQHSDGAFELKTQRGKDQRLPFWLGLALCRALDRF